MLIKIKHVAQKRYGKDYLKKMYDRNEFYNCNSHYFVLVAFKQSACHKSTVQCDGFYNTHGRHEADFSCFYKQINKKCGVLFLRLINLKKY